MKRLCSLFVSVALVWGLCPALAWADDAKSAGDAPQLDPVTAAKATDGAGESAASFAVLADADSDSGSAVEPADLAALADLDAADPDAGAPIVDPDAEGDLGAPSFPDPSDPTRGFSDVLASDWYVTEGWLASVVDSGLMSGYLHTSRFGANDTLTRGQAVTILYRYAHPEAIDTIVEENWQASAPFSDTTTPAYYNAAISWACEHGIVTGYADPQTGASTGLFGPDDPVTREQLAALAARFAVSLGVSMQCDPELFWLLPDCADAYGYAVDALAWCVDNGIISGDIDATSGVTYLRAHNTATRAQMAKIITLVAQRIERQSGAQPASTSAADAPLANGVYEMYMAGAPGVVFEVENASLSENANVRMWTSNANQCQRWLFTCTDQGYYTITSVRSGLALGVQRSGQHLCSNVVQLAADGSDATLWNVRANADGSFTLISKVSGLALDVADGSAEAGTNVHTYTDCGIVGQRLSIVAAPAISEGVYAISPKLDSSLRLNVVGSEQGEGANVTLQANNGSLGQKWFVQANDDGTYTLEAVCSGNVLDIAGAQAVNGANVWQWESLGIASQRWILTPAGDGSFVVTSALDGRALDVVDAQAWSGVNVFTWDAYPTLSQHWVFEPTGLLADGEYTVSSLANGGVKLDVAGASIADGANVWLWQQNGGYAQIVRITCDDQGYYTIKFPFSGLVLGVADEGAQVGANVCQRAATGDDAQKWALIYAGSGAFCLQNKKSGMVLDVAGGSANSGANVQLAQRSGSVTQAFSFSSTTYLSGNEELDDAITYLINSRIGRGENALRTAFDYVVGYRYVSGSKYPTGDWSIPFALEMYNNGGGNCYRFAALFMWLARALGYDANVVSGWVPAAAGGQAAHGWVEIHQDGQTLVCDPDMANAMPYLNWFMLPYASMPCDYGLWNGTTLSVGDMVAWNALSMTPRALVTSALRGEDGGDDGDGDVQGDAPDGTSAAADAAAATVPAAPETAPGTCGETESVREIG